jgi:hypothetical protein
MVTKFGWCLDELHEGCRDSYTLMWPPVDDYGPKKGSKKDKVVQEERLRECSCECHERVAATGPRPEPAPKKRAARPRQ